MGSCRLQAQSLFVVGTPMFELVSFFPMLASLLNLE